VPRLVQRLDPQVDQSDLLALRHEGVGNRAEARLRARGDRRLRERAEGPPRLVEARGGEAALRAEGATEGRLGDAGVPGGAWGRRGDRGGGGNRVAIGGDRVAGGVEHGMPPLVGGQPDAGLRHADSIAGAGSAAGWWAWTFLRIMATATIAPANASSAAT